MTTDVMDRLDERMVAFIDQQHVFFVATACAQGRVNLSPKGMDTLRVLDPGTVAYLDLTGSGNETAAHVAADGRITLMLCSFDRRPLILRLYGRGEVVTTGSADWDALRARFPDYPGVRQIIVVHVEGVTASCGYAVPVMGPAVPRDALVRWSERQGDEGLRQFREEYNTVSLDGLPTPPLPDARTG